MPKKPGQKPGQKPATGGGSGAASAPVPGSAPTSTGDVAAALLAAGGDDSKAGAGGEAKAGGDGREASAAAARDLSPIALGSIADLDSMPYPKVAIIFLINYVYELYYNNSSTFAAVSDSELRGVKLALAKRVLDACIDQEFTSLEGFCAAISKVIDEILSAGEKKSAARHKAIGSLGTFVAVLRFLMRTLSEGFTADACKARLQKSAPAFAEEEGLNVEAYFGMTGSLAEVLGTPEGMVLDHLITRYWLVAILEHEWSRDGATDALIARVADNGRKLSAKVAAIQSAVAELFADRHVYGDSWARIVGAKLSRMVAVLERENHSIEADHSTPLQTAGRMAGSMVDMAKGAKDWFASAMSRAATEAAPAPVPTRRSLAEILAVLRRRLDPASSASASAGAGGPRAGVTS